MMKGCHKIYIPYDVFHKDSSCNRPYRSYSPVGPDILPKCPGSKQWGQWTIQTLELHPRAGKQRLAVILGVVPYLLTPCGGWRASFEHLVGSARSTEPDHARIMRIACS